MKKSCMFIITRLLSFITCIGFACVGPINPSKVCNIITNLDEFSDEYYAVLTCYGYGCPQKGGYYILEENTDCIEGGGKIFYIPRNIPFDALDIDFKDNVNEGHFISNYKDIGGFILGHISNSNWNCDGSDADEETNIYKIVKNENGISMELVHTYKGYDVRSEVEELGELGNNTKILLIICGITAICCFSIGGYTIYKKFKK